MTDNHSAPAGADVGRRIPTLDGLRGSAIIMVVISHYFGELPHGVPATMFGWIGVDIFFVLSGFLIGKLILDRQHHANFFAVFYARRSFRIIPPYVVTLVVVAGLITVLPSAWTDASVRFPLWSYLTFVQGFFMISTQSIGAHWLAPTWTLAVEEHFYLLAPAAIVFTPRRWLTPALIAAGATALVFRGAIYFGGVGNEMMGLALLPGRSDIIICGILTAIVFRNKDIVWSRYMLPLRATPILALVVALGLRLVSSPLFQVFGPFVVAVGCSAFLLGLVVGTPEARRFNSKVLRVCGDNAYCTYLTHLPVLGLMHGLILGAKPDLGGPAQWLVALASLPVCVVVGWGMTKLIEEPLTRYGRTWKWKAAVRPSRAHAVDLTP